MSTLSTIYKNFSSHRHLRCRQNSNWIGSGSHVESPSLATFHVSQRLGEPELISYTKTLEKERRDRRVSVICYTKDLRWAFINLTFKSDYLRCFIAQETTKAINFALYKFGQSTNRNGVIKENCVITELLLTNRRWVLIQVLMLFGLGPKILLHLLNTFFMIWN